MSYRDDQALFASSSTITYCKMRRSILSSLALAALAEQASARVWSRSLYNETTANHTCQLGESHSHKTRDIKANPAD